MVLVIGSISKKSYLFASVVRKEPNFIMLLIKKLIGINEKG